MQRGLPLGRAGKPSPHAKPSVARAFVQFWSPSLGCRLLNPYPCDNLRRHVNRRPDYNLAGYLSTARCGARPGCAGPSRARGRVGRRRPCSRSSPRRRSRAARHGGRAPRRSSAAESSRGRPRRGDRGAGRRPIVSGERDRILAPRRTSAGGRRQAAFGADHNSPSESWTTGTATR
jgi:hypothetical protein